MAAGDRRWMVGFRASPPAGTGAASPAGHVLRAIAFLWWPIALAVLGYVSWLLTREDLGLGGDELVVFLLSVLLVAVVGLVLANRAYARLRETTSRRDPAAWAASAYAALVGGIGVWVPTQTVITHWAGYLFVAVVALLAVLGLLGLALLAWPAGASGE